MVNGSYISRVCVCVCVCVWRTTGARLIASMHLDPQVSLPGGTVPRFSTVRLSDGCDDLQPDGYDDVKPLKVDKFTVTNGDFMYTS